jgi:phosphate:Na+ symporter
MIALVVATGSSGVITLRGAIGLICGANIGTCVTGFVAAARGTPAARRASVAQIIINVLGVLLFLPFVTPYASLLSRTSAYLPRQIANAHTIFNVAVSVILFPFIRPIRRLSELIIPEEPTGEVTKVTRFLDDELLAIPSVAIVEAAKELERMGATTVQMIELSRKALIERDADTAIQVLRLEREVVDPLCDAIERFVDSVVSQELDSQTRRRCFQLKNVNVDLERVADHAENMAEAAEDRIYHEVPFSEEAIRDLDRTFTHAKLTLGTALDAFHTGDRSLALRACRLEDEMDHMTLGARQAHMSRLRNGKCHPEAGVLFVETLRNLERTGDHADNVALTILRKS